jgi:hypothetical protein
MTAERQLASGLLSKSATFRLIVSGAVGVKELEWLIAKLQVDRNILVEQRTDEQQLKESVK